MEIRDSLICFTFALYNKVAKVLYRLIEDMHVCIICFSFIYLYFFSILRCLLFLYLTLFLISVAGKGPFIELSFPVNKKSRLNSKFTGNISCIGLVK